MPNARFTWDEALLAIDVLYQAGEKPLSPASPEIEALSALLNRLPIVPVEKRPDNFRNCSGVSRQIFGFRRCLSTGRNELNTGEIFFDVYRAFGNSGEAIHQVAEAIRRNVNCFDELPFGNPSETEGFPEGALLGHLHRVIEQRDGAKAVPEERCCICYMEPSLHYRPCGNLLQMHLLVPPTEMNGRKTYQQQDFLTVCPICHAVLHRMRPWHTREDCADILL